MEVHVWKIFLSKRPLRRARLARRSKSQKEAAGFLNPGGVFRLTLAGAFPSDSLEPARVFALVR